MSVMRHKYRELLDEEKQAMEEIKDAGEKLHNLLEEQGHSRELSIAETKVEESVMWAVKHITR